MEVWRGERRSDLLKGRQQVTGTVWCPNRPPQLRLNLKRGTVVAFWFLFDLFDVIVFLLSGNLQQIMDLAPLWFASLPLLGISIFSFFFLLEYRLK